MTPNSDTQPTGQGGSPVSQLEEVLRQVLSGMKDEQHKDQTVSHWLSSELLRQEFKLTSKISEQKFLELTTEIKGMGQNFVTQTEFKARKELDDREHEQLRIAVGTKADADLVKNRLDKLERIVWVGTSSTMVAILLALLNLVLRGR